MLVGDASQRAKVGNGKKSQSCFRCYTGPNYGGDNAAPCQDAKCVPLALDFAGSLLTDVSRLDTENFPAAACPGGIRSNVLYPTYGLFHLCRERIIL
jgi:hypothetical protein